MRKNEPEMTADNVIEIVQLFKVKFHTGYKLDENDYRDVKALCQRFGIVIPVEYEEFERKDNQGSVGPIFEE